MLQQSYADSLMRATNFEFRYRFFIFVGIFLVGFEARLGHSRLITAQFLAILTGHPTRELIQLFISIGALIIAVAAALRTWATAYLKANVVHDMTLHSDRVVADGPYRYVRNPLYLGCILLVVGIGVLARFPNWILLIAVTILFYLRLILREEDALTQSQPESYGTYKRAVPRLFPAVTPRLPSAGKTARWLQASIAESCFWVFALGQFYFALTFDYHTFFIITGAALVIYAVAHLINSVRQKRQRRSHH